MVGSLILLSLCFFSVFFFLSSTHHQWLTRCCWIDKSYRFSFSETAWRFVFVSVDLWSMSNFNHFCVLLLRFSKNDSVLKFSGFLKLIVAFSLCVCDFLDFRAALLRNLCLEKIIWSVCVIYIYIYIEFWGFWCWNGLSFNRIRVFFSLNLVLLSFCCVVNAKIF